jgi:hypothetical protein
MYQITKIVKWLALKRLFKIFKKQDFEVNFATRFF